MNQSMDEPDPSDFEKTPGLNQNFNDEEDYDSGPGTHDYVSQ